MIFRIIVFCLVISTASALNAKEIRQASDVFKKWISCQKVVPNCNLAQIFQDQNRALTIKKFYEQNLTKLRRTTNFLDALSNGAINKHGHQIKTELSSAFENNLTKLVASAHSDMPMFLQCLKEFQFSEIPHASITEQINAYNALMTLIFAHEKEDVQHDILFTLANRFFEFSFSVPTAQAFQQMLLTRQNQPLVRMMYSVMWEKLAGNGWKNWHEKSLRTLKQEADAGKTIVYLAGGSDIYQMITHGIYSIHIVDPQLPTQPKYYADQWDWLIKNNENIDGGLGDQIVFNDQNLIMDRVFFKELESSFSMQLSNRSSIRLPQSVTQWDILNHEHQIIGRVIFERRPVVQEDFIVYPHTTLLMSFNELYFIALPKNLGGWGIEPAQFGDNFQMTVKQLCNPISRQTVCSMRAACLLNSSDLKFIDLGTCVN